MNIVFSITYKGNKDAIQRSIKNFETQGKKFDDRNRNAIKLFNIDGNVVNIKSFKIPNIINRVAYKFIRSSKAQRSFEYAHKLLEKQIHTPLPIAYFEEKSGFTFGRSYYVSEHLDCDLTYRDLIDNSPYAGNEDILAAFARFTYELHKKEIYFLDHSPGNTLIKIKEDGYEFYLVDLNRMKFGSMDFKTRMKNFERLSKIESQVKIMATAYATASGEDSDLVFGAMWEGIQGFQERFHKKQNFKKKLKFWKKEKTA
ncbi:Kdo domain containing protein [Dokdonia sinensis]|uniref:Kdo domain containing protein n=1 Tax=Dokdonia sinensis TaxID=2479847 RepID=A0A3M0G3P1_9FLAO|nr:lipopolysaccharide kinase InaA family protein [Dokdonia sinensis]RMB59425.1 Kdo domain containing protein [Dokdonia sinensis]